MWARLSRLKSKFCDLLHDGPTAKRLAVFAQCEVTLWPSSTLAVAQKFGRWGNRPALARKPRILVTVALANKMARIIWALLVKQGNYRAPVAAKA